MRQMRRRGQAALARSFGQRAGRAKARGAGSGRARGNLPPHRITAPPSFQTEGLIAGRPASLIRSAGGALADLATAAWRCA